MCMAVCSLAIGITSLLSHMPMDLPVPSVQHLVQC
jgi:hypothetical protein